MSSPTVVIVTTLGSAACAMGAKLTGSRRTLTEPAGGAASGRRQRRRVARHRRRPRGHGRRGVVAVPAVRPVSTRGGDEAPEEAEDARARHHFVFDRST